MQNTKKSGSPSTRDRHPGRPGTFSSDGALGIGRLWSTTTASKMGIVSLETDTFNGYYYAEAGCSYVSPVKELALAAHDGYTL